MMKMTRKNIATFPILELVFEPKMWPHSPGLEMLVQVLPGGEGVLPHADGGAVVDGVAELGQRHVKLVHRGQVLAGLPVTLEPGLLKFKLLWHLVSFLFVYDLYQFQKKILGLNIIFERSHKYPT